MEEVILKQPELTEDEISEKSANLIQCILWNDLRLAELLVEPLTNDVRKDLTRKHSYVDVNPALFTAIRYGNLKFITFLIKKCYADVEERGIYRVEDDNSVHIVTPLWCAAVSNKLDVVELLVNLGADVNAMSDTGSTPIRSSCYMTNTEVVKFLADNGGDLEMPNQNGGTCLINSVQDTDLCKFLIERGVNVNAHDSSGNIALHYAIKEGHFRTVQILVENGCDPYLRNDQGDDALQCASLRGYVDIVDYLIRTINPSVERQIESYQLLGGSFAEEKANIFESLLMWKKAIELREGSDNKWIMKKTMTPNVAYDLAIEAATLVELEELRRNRNSVFMQALLLREKILGPSHKDTIFGLMYRGAVYADAYDYFRCMRLWKYAFRLCQSNGDYLCHDYIFTLQALCKLFLEIFNDDVEVSAKNGLTFDEVYEILEMVIHKTQAHSNTSHDILSEFQQEKLLSLMKLMLHLIALLIKLTSCQSQAFVYKKLIYRLLGCALRTFDGQSVFLLAVSKDTSCIGSEFYSAFPNVSVVQVLLECGANAVEMDNEGNTALHILEENIQNRDIITQIAEMLVAEGCHADARNCKGIPASDRLKMDFSSQITLKCLCAHVVKKFAIHYGEILPRSLHDFIEMH